MRIVQIIREVPGVVNGKKGGLDVHGAEPFKIEKEPVELSGIRAEKCQCSTRRRFNSLSV